MTTQEKLQAGKRLTKCELASAMQRKAPDRCHYMLLMYCTRQELVDKYNTLFQTNIK